jgi:hypothetical protein
MATLEAERASKADSVRVPKRSRSEFQAKIRALDEADSMALDEAADLDEESVHAKPRTSKLEQRKRAATEATTSGGQDVGIGSAGLEEALYDEDGDPVLPGQKVGDSYSLVSKREKRRMDQKLDAIMQGRLAEGLGVHHLPVAQHFKPTYTVVPPDGCPPMTRELFSAATAPIVSIHRQQQRRRERPNTLRLLEHVPEALRTWLTGMPLYETIETRFMMPIFLGRSTNLPAGRGLNLVRIANFVEASVGIDLDRVLLTYHWPERPDWLPHWSAQYAAHAIATQTSVAIEAKMIQTLVCALDFHLDEKQVFRLRLVYVIAALTPKAEQTPFLAAERAKSQDVDQFLNHSASLSMLVMPLGLTPEANLASITRSEFYQTRTSPLAPTRTSAVDSGRESVSTVELFAALGACFVGHYYHSPQDAETAHDESTRRTIHQEFVITNPFADKPA